MPNIHTYTIGAYTPYYDAKQLADPSVVDGKNFMPSVSGYKSSFGTDVLTDRKLDKELLLNSQIFSLNEEALVICNRYGIMQFDESSEGWYYLVKASSELTSSSPWSVAYVGGDWFFCKLGFGVWRYRLDERSGMFLDTNVPSDPISICASGGRLVILGSSVYAWSAIGDGTNLATSLVTGAGFQALSLIGGKPLAVRSNTIGFMVYTTAGIIRVELVDTPNPYNHRVLATSDYAPVSAWAICEIGNGSHVFLAKSGLYATSGDYPQILEKDFSKWLTGTTLKYLLQSRYDLPLAINYDASHRWIFISYAEYSITASPYSLAYVLDIELGKWGKFVRNHYFVTSAYIPVDKFRGYRTVTATTDGAIRLINKDYGWSLMASDSSKSNYPVCYRPSYSEIDNNHGSPSTLNVFTGAAQLETYDWNKLGQSVMSLGMFEFKLAFSTVSITLDKPMGFVASYFISGLDGDVVIDMNNNQSSEDTFANMGDLPFASEDVYINMNEVSYDNGITIFTDWATADAKYSVYRELKVNGKLANLDSSLEIGLYHIADFDNLQCSTIMTGFAEFHEQTTGETDSIDMQEIQDITIDMEQVADNTIDMGIGFLSSPNFSTKLTSSSDGYGHRNLHIATIEPYSIVGDRFNYNSYSTGLYHGFSIATTQAGGYYHLKQIQVNIVQGGLIYDGA